MTTCSPRPAPDPATGARYRRAAVVAGVVVGMLLAVGLTAHRTSAAWSAKTSNSASTFGVGTVGIGTDLGGTVMFDTSDAKLTTSPALTRCIEVRYTGTAAAAIKLYATTPKSDPDGLGAYLTLTVHEGTGSAGRTCSGFSTGGSQIYSGTFANFVNTKNSYANGVSSWTPSGAENRMFRFTLSVSASAPATVQGAAATVTFKWEAA